MLPVWVSWAVVLLCGLFSSFKKCLSSSNRIAADINTFTDVYDYHSCGHINVCIHRYVRSYILVKHQNNNVISVNDEGGEHCPTTGSKNTLCPFCPQKIQIHENIYQLLTSPLTHIRQTLHLKTNCVSVRQLGHPISKAPLNSAKSCRPLFPGQRRRILHGPIYSLHGSDMAAKSKLLVNKNSCF